MRRKKLRKKQIDTLSYAFIKKMIKIFPEVNFCSTASDATCNNKKLTEDQACHLLCQKTSQTNSD